MNILSADLVVGSALRTEYVGLHVLLVGNALEDIDRQRRCSAWSWSSEAYLSHMSEASATDESLVGQLASAAWAVVNHIQGHLAPPLGLRPPLRLSMDLYGREALSVARELNGGPSSGELAVS